MKFINFHVETLGYLLNLIVLIEFMYLTVLPTNSTPFNTPLPPTAYAHKLVNPFPVIQYSSKE